MDNKIIGLNIKKYRKAAGYTQEQLAELLDISTVHMSHMECGHVSMSIDLLLKLCDVLNVTPDSILSGTFSVPASLPSESALDGIPKRLLPLACKMLELLRDYPQE